MREEKGVHNLLYVYAPNDPTNEDTWDIAYEEYYPGDDLVDIVAFDRYSTQAEYPDHLQEDCRAVANFSRYHDKVAAISETGILDGIQDVTDPMWCVGYIYRTTQIYTYQYYVLTAIVHACTPTSPNPNQTFLATPSM